MKKIGLLALPIMCMSFSSFSAESLHIKGASNDPTNFVNVGQCTEMKEGYSNRIPLDIKRHDKDAQLTAIWSLLNSSQNAQCPRGTFMSGVRMSQGALIPTCCSFQLLKK